MAERVKLAVVLRDFSGGGAERAMINIANGLARLSVDVEMLVFSEEGPFRDYLDPAVRLVCLGAPTLGLSTFRAVLPLRRYFKSSGVTHVLATLEASTIVAFYACRWLAKPPQLIIRVATTFSQEQRTPLRELLIRHVYRQHSGLFVANSRGSAENLAQTLGIGSDRITVIYNGVDLALIQQMAAEPSPDVGLQQGDHYILNIGRLTYAKRQDILIRSFACLKDPRLKLVILGEGPLRLELESLARDLAVQDRVLMPGFVANPYAVLAGARAFVLSSCYEGMPTVLIEAMACQCPVVSTDCPSGPAEILVDEHFAPLVPVNDEAALAEAIEHCLLNPMENSKLLARAQEFSIEVMGEKYRCLIRGGRP